MLTRLKTYQDTGLTQKVARYMISGLTVLGFQVSLVYLFTSILNIWYLASSMLAFWLAFMLSFVLQKLWTFQNKERKKVPFQLFNFFLFSIFGLTFNTALIYLLVDIFNLHYMISQLIAIFIVATSGFFVYGIIFKKDEVDTVD